ncbi:MAG: hypothetical protein ABIH63_04140 [archaeon]
MLKFLPLIALIVIVLTLAGMSFADNIVAHNISPQSRSDVKMGSHRLEAKPAGSEVVVYLDGEEIWRGTGEHYLEARSTETETVIKIDGKKIWPK